MEESDILLCLSGAGCHIVFLVPAELKKTKKKKAALQKETEESLRIELRAVEPDTVTLHPGETGRYDHGDDGIYVYVCERENKEKTQSRRKEGE